MPLHVIRQGPSPLEELSAAVAELESEGQQVLQVIDYAGYWGILATPSRTRQKRTQSKRATTKRTTTRKASAS